MAVGVSILGVAAVVAVATVGTAGASGSKIEFRMVRSGVAQTAGCLAKAKARVTVVSHGVNETLTLRAHGLPPNTGFDLFVLQVPNAPFGLSWYQSDLQSNNDGEARVTVMGRFNIETFAVAPGAANAPNVHNGKDATTNPAFQPIHTFHLGFWFDSPTDAAKAGCPSTVTPFNGDHTAGVQAMSTRNFPDDKGPLSRLK